MGEQQAEGSRKNIHNRQFPGKKFWRIRYSIDKILFLRVHVECNECALTLKAENGPRLHN